MFDYQVKVTLTILGAIAFSLVMILLVFIVPINKKDTAQFENSKKKNMLEQISHSMKKDN